MITGTVHEIDSATAVADAEVKALTGNETIVARTNEQGQFGVGVPVGSAAVLSVSRSGYLTATRTFGPLTESALIDLPLIPLAVRSQWQGTLRAAPVNGVNYSIIDGVPSDIAFTAHQDGTMMIEFDVACVAFGSYTDTGFQLTQDDGREVGWVWATGNGQAAPYHYSKTFPVAQGRYHVHPYSSSYIGAPCPLTLTVTRPG